MTVETKKLRTRMPYLGISHTLSTDGVTLETIVGRLELSTAHSLQYDP